MSERNDQRRIDGARERAKEAALKGAEHEAGLASARSLLEERLHPVFGDGVGEWVDGLNLGAFLDESGAVNERRVDAHLANFVPPKPSADLKQGMRGRPASVSPVDANDLFRATVEELRYPDRGDRW